MKKYEVRVIKKEHVKAELSALAFHKTYINTAIDKYKHHLIKINNLKTPAANILKQTALSKGADLAVSNTTVTCATDFTDCLLSVTKKQLRLIIESIKEQYFGLKELAVELEELFNRDFGLKHPSMKIRNKEFFWGNQTYIMGIINATPDSFSDGGKNLELDKAINTVTEMISSGADIIDIGGESTRPFSVEVNSETQKQRILPIIKEIRRISPEIIISTDTRNADVAKAAIESGVDIINDVSGMMHDPRMATIATEYDVPVVLMHSLASPETMQINPEYKDVMTDVSKQLLHLIENAVNKGIKENKIILDPGIGFGKTLDHNIELINRISEIRSLGYPLLVGVSRKSFIGKILNTDVSDREVGSAAIHSYLISQGVDILRVHDTSYHGQIAKISDAISRFQM